MKDVVTKESLASILKMPNQDLRDLVSYRDIQTGKGIQTSVMIAMIVTAIGVIISIISFIIKFI